MADRLSEEQLVVTARGSFVVRHDTGGRLPVCLLHGWPDTPPGWHSLAESLDPNFHLIAPALRGFSGSTTTPEVEDYSKLELARDMIAVIDALGHHEFCLVGHDWGGAVAQEIALLRPERVRRLLLLNTPIVSNLRGWQAAVAQSPYVLPIYTWYQGFMNGAGVPELLLPGREAAFIDMMMRDGSGGLLPQALRDDATASLAAPGGITAAANLYRALRIDLRHWAPQQGQRITCPTLYLRGTKDPVITEYYLRGIDQSFSDFSQVTLPHGHFLHIEAPEAVAAAVNQFFRSELQVAA